MKLAAKVVHGVAVLVMTVAISPFLLLFLAVLGGRSLYRWAELHAVYRGDVGARNKALAGY